VANVQKATDFRFVGWPDPANITNSNKDIGRQAKILEAFSRRASRAPTWIEMVMSIDLLIIHTVNWTSSAPYLECQIVHFNRYKYCVLEHRFFYLVPEFKNPN